jgi:uncharacterized protein YjbI with pentapeptide repeats
MESDTSSTQRPVIQASEILAKIERGEPVEYDGVIVEGDLDISELDLPTEHVDRTEPEFRSGLSEVLKVVRSQITITNSEIRGKVNFSNARVQEPINFSLTKFTGRNADFMGAEFSGNAYFGISKFTGGDTNFGRAKFTGGSADFMGAEFGGNAYFWDAEFGGNAYFWDAEFGGNASFSDAEFGGDTNFRRAKFTGRDAIFVGAKFTGGNVYFEEAEFGGNAYFGDAEFGGDTNFRRAKFTGRHAYFWEAEFGGDAYFEEAEFGGGAYFESAKFTGGYAYFEGAKFDVVLNIDNIKFNRLYITWESIKDRLIYSGPVYLALIKNFKVIERFNDADDCYYAYRKESQTQKKWYSEKNRLIDFLIRGYNWISTTIKRISEYFGWINNYPPFTWIHRFNWSKLLDCLGFVSCGYGVRIQPIILWVLGSVLGFTLLYKLLPQSYGGIAESGPSTVTMEAVNNSTLLLTFSSGDGAVSPSWGECLYFSFTALTGGTPDGLHPVGLVKYAVMIEGVLGYLFLALFVVVLARKIIR